MSFRIFQTETLSPRQITYSATPYTALVTDDLIQISGSGAVTLPSLLSFQQTLLSKKVYAIQNVGSVAVTIQPGTNGSTGVADTINGRAVWTVMPNETVLIEGNGVQTNWTIISPTLVPALNRVPFCVVATTSSITPINVFDANGAPVNLDVTAVDVVALSTTAANITLMNGASTICTIAAGTTASIVTGASAYTWTAVAAGATFQVVSSSAGNATVRIWGTMQQYV